VTSFIIAAIIFGAIMLAVLAKSGIFGAREIFEDPRKPGRHFVKDGVVKLGDSTDPHAENFDLNKDHRIWDSSSIP
jgi:hypothetical protein